VQAIAKEDPGNPYRDFSARWRRLATGSAACIARRQRVRFAPIDLYPDWPVVARTNVKRLARARSVPGSGRGQRQRSRLRAGGRRATTTNRTRVNLRRRWCRPARRTRRAMRSTACSAAITLASESLRRPGAAAAALGPPGRALPTSTRRAPCRRRSRDLHRSARAAIAAGDSLRPRGRGSTRRLRRNPGHPWAPIGGGPFARRRRTIVAAASRIPSSGPRRRAAAPPCGLNPRRVRLDAVRTTPGGGPPPSACRRRAT